MKRLGFIIFGLCAALLLVGCFNPDGTPKPVTKAVVTVGCVIDGVGVPAATIGAKVYSVVNPAVAPEVALATQADQLVHPQVVAACAQFNAHPVSVDVKTEVVDPGAGGGPVITPPPSSGSSTPAAQPVTPAVVPAAASGKG